MKNNKKNSNTMNQTHTIMTATEKWCLVTETILTGGYVEVRLYPSFNSKKEAEEYGFDLEQNTRSSVLELSLLSPQQFIETADEWAAYEKAYNQEIDKIQEEYDEVERRHERYIRGDM